MRRSRHLAAAAFLLLFIFGVQNVSSRNVPALRGTSLESECYTFVGKVDCQNGERILPSARVTLMEYDPLVLYDKVSTAQVYEEGYYKIYGCVDDNGFLGNVINGNVELFLEFDNVCFAGQIYLVSNPIPDKFESHLLGGEENNDIGTGIEANNDNDKNGMTLSNQRISRPQHRRFKYPPVPRPYNHRLRRRTYYCGDGYTKLPRWKYTFKGIIRCYNEKDGFTMPFSESGVVKIMEYDRLPTDDLMATSTINKRTGEYEVTGEVYDIQISGPWDFFHEYSDFAEIYLQFENVCSPGDSYEFRCPQPGLFHNLKITNGELQEV